MTKAVENEMSKAVYVNVILTAKADQLSEK